MNKLNLGCGKDIKEGYINLDIVDYGGNRIHDINTFPYPFEENYFDEIYASHILEHLNNFHNSITELYRILKPNGIFYCSVPVPERKKSTAVIHGKLYSLDDLKKLFENKKFNFRPFPDENGALLYFRANLYD